ncbi:monofunctional biosynthetic peptidoglycan transglycosylase [Halalkalibacillus sediminis]|uniref:Monofunctional biosynthetic peptidoglycan transglycosylase n=1 Tax=Halalkalibacillus sediminis TaxID=2018042 RepID=A0A2I0QS43_9BACI|nr:transglycosylase domain-containing protein [Halalkalibacillus sediminis]PKR77175.1 monofunctional biosynthetic peptidoglycan transglycosylase [Halalkalibacillus sediminis]
MIKKILTLITAFVAFSLTFAVVIIIYSVLQGPPIYDIEENTVIYDQNGEIISIERGIENRFWLELDEISPHVIDAFIAAEDQHFYDHFGFDFKRIGGAIYHNILSMNKGQGASTITQQYARNIFLTHTKSWERKINEALIALRLEIFQSKNEILEGYINTIYFGHGQYGIEAASQYYFDKESSELELEEAALLAGIPKGPSVYSPIQSETNALDRQSWILKRMHETGKITKSQYNDAVASDVNVITTASVDDRSSGQYFTDYVLNQASELLDIDRDQLEGEGYHIYTTMQPEAQKELESTVLETIPEGELQIGAITIDHHSGKIVALQGGKDFDKSPYNRVIQSKRMTGSTFKPFLYYAALVYGYTPSTTLESRPTSFTLDNGKEYTPANFNNHYAEHPITLAQAVALSDNIYAVKTNMFVQPENLIEAARTFGIESDLPAVPSLALGPASISPYEMARAYSILGNEGWSVEPYALEKIVDRNGNVIYQHSPEPPERLLEENYAFVLTHLLTGMFDTRLNGYMQVTGATVANQLSRPYAGKSGSTPSDSWMIGYSPEYTTAVWTGFDDNTEIKRTQDQRVAKNVWATYMEKLHADLPIEPFRVPTGVQGVKVDPITGLLEGPACEDRTKIMYYLKGTEPTKTCSEPSSS